MKFIEKCAYKCLHAIPNSIEWYCDYFRLHAPYKLRKPMIYILLRPLHFLVKITSEPGEVEDFKEDWEQVKLELDETIEEQKISNSKLSKVLE